MRDSLLFLIRTLSHLYLLLFLLRFIMQWVRADFYNPLAQFIVKATDPLVAPARKVIPATARFDLPTLVLLILLEVIVTWLLLYFGSLLCPSPYDDRVISGARIQDTVVSGANRERQIGQSFHGAIRRRPRRCSGRSRRFDRIANPDQIAMRDIE